MVFTNYGTPNIISTSSALPEDRPGLFGLFVADDSRSANELIELVTNELTMKSAYFHSSIDTLILSIHERYWTPEFITNFERIIPPAVTRTVVKLFNPEKYELTRAFNNARGTLDGFPRDPGDDRAPLDIHSSLLITLDALVEHKLDVLQIVLEHRDLASFTVLPPLGLGRSHDVYLDAVVQIMSKLLSSVRVNVVSAFNWTTEDLEEIDFTLQERRS